MKYALLSILGLMTTPATTYTTTGTVWRADPVERRIFATGVKPEQFYFSFKSQYRIDGKPVTAAAWWRYPKVGKTMQVKAVNRINFWWVTAANIQTKGAP